MKKIHMIISGRVQGVGFRYSTYGLALEIGEIYGRVWNTDDGRVEILAQSPNNEKLNRFIQAVKNGPSTWAKVTYVEMRMEPFEDFTDFKILN